jgi:hypothetical protein
MWRAVPRFHVYAKSSVDCRPQISTRLHLHLLALRLLATRHLNTVHDVLGSFLRGDLGCLGGVLNLLHGDMAVVAVAFVWFSASTIETHNFTPP